MDVIEAWVDPKGINMESKRRSSPLDARPFRPLNGKH
jgi:hypothetical protein